LGRPCPARQIANAPEFWPTAQVARLGGFATSHPIDWRLIRALAVETHENWLEANRYLNMNDQGDEESRSTSSRMTTTPSCLLQNLLHTTPPCRTLKTCAKKVVVPASRLSRMAAPSAATRSRAMDLSALETAVLSRRGADVAQQSARERLATPNPPSNATPSIAAMRS